MYGLVVGDVTSGYISTVVNKIVYTVYSFKKNIYINDFDLNQVILSSILHVNV